MQIATIGKYAAENSNAAALRDSRHRMTSEKTPYDYSRSSTGSVQESRCGCGQTQHVQNAIIKFAFYLKIRKRNHFTTHLKPGLRYLNKALRDCLVCGLRSEAIQRCLLSETDLMFSRAFEIAQGMEVTEKNAQQLKGADSAIQYVVQLLSASAEQKA